MAHRLPASARLACVGVKVAVIGTIGVLALGADPGAAVGQGPAPLDAGQQLLTSRPAPLERQLARHDCSTTGFDTDQQPVSALVRSARGSLRFVDFDTGWRIYTRHGAATLVAVCLAAPPQRRVSPAGR